MEAVNQRISGLTFDSRAVLKILVILLGLMALATIVSGGVFLQPGNLLNLVNQNAMLTIVALGQLLVIITGGIDLSVGTSLAISSVLIVLYQDYGTGPAFAVALLAALAIGLTNGLLVTYVRLPAFVVTLATMQIGASIAKVLSGGGAVYTGYQGALLPESLTEFYKGSLSGIPYPLVVCLLFIGLIAWYLRTSTGHFTFPVGGNQRAAFLSGLPVKRVKMAVYAISAGLCAVAGLLFVSRVGMGDPQTGTYLPLDSIAAVSIGGASLSGGVGTVAGTFIGVIILSVLNNIMNLLGVPPTLQPAIKGIVILLAVYLNSARRQS
jgi:ribose transport system permease protein